MGCCGFVDISGEFGEEFSGHIGGDFHGEYGELVYCTR